MTELRLALSEGALEALVFEGAVLEFEVEGIRVLLRADDEALEAIRQEVQRAMLAAWPASPYAN